ncbi:unnamed protein product, partial [Amoebophrya sp. A25]
GLPVVQQRRARPTIDTTVAEEARKRLSLSSSAASENLAPFLERSPTFGVGVASTNLGEEEILQDSSWSTESRVSLAALRLSQQYSNFRTTAPENLEAISRRGSIATTVQLEHFHAQRNSIDRLVSTPRGRLSTTSCTSAGFLEDTRPRKDSKAQASADSHIDATPHNCVEDFLASSSEETTITPDNISVQQPASNLVVGNYELQQISRRRLALPLVHFGEQESTPPKEQKQLQTEEVLPSTTATIEEPKQKALSNQVKSEAEAAKQVEDIKMFGGFGSNLVPQEEVTEVPGWQASTHLPVLGTSTEPTSEPVLSLRCKLYKHAADDQSWRDNGVGEGRIFCEKGADGHYTSFFQMFQQTTEKSILNLQLFPTMFVSKNENNPKTAVFAGITATGEEKVCLKFKTEELAEQFRDCFDRYKDAANAGLKYTDAVGTAEASDSDYASVLGGVSKEATATAPEDEKETSSGDTSPTVDPSTSAPNASPFAGLFSNAPPSGGGLFSNSTSTNGGLSGLFGGGATTSTTTSSSATTTSAAEADAAARGALTGAARAAFIENAQKTATAARTRDVELVEDKEEVWHVPGWRPDDAKVLETKTDLQTGQEAETTLFTHRSKLFRFRDGDWKERGLGDCFLLAKPLAEAAGVGVKPGAAYETRFLMRQEKTGKVKGNSLLVDMEGCCNIAYQLASKKVVQWSAQDCSEEDPEATTFGLRFGQEATAAKFKEIFAKCRGGLTEAEFAELKAEADDADENKGGDGADQSTKAAAPSTFAAGDDASKQNKAVAGDDKSAATPALRTEGSAVEPRTEVSTGAVETAEVESDAASTVDTARQSKENTDGAKVDCKIAALVSQESLNFNCPNNAVPAASVDMPIGGPTRFDAAPEANGSSGG